MTEHHTILGGKVHVYKRPNSSLWQCSSFFAGRNRRTSTKEDSLSRAKEIAEDWYRIRSHWLIIRNQNVTEVRFDNALYSGRELADLLKKAGFERVKLFGSLQGITYDLNAKRLVAVAMKPA